MAKDDYDPATLEQQKEASAAPVTTLRAAVAAHLGGAPWDWIADHYAYSSPQVARVAVEKFLGETYTSSDLAGARNKARARYERLLQSVWFDATHPFVTTTDGKPSETRNEYHASQLDKARALVGDLARLDGLNAPTQLQLYVPGAEEIMTVVSDLRAVKMAGMAKEADIFDAEILEAEFVEEEGHEDAQSA